MFSPPLILALIFGYFLILLLIAALTSRQPHSQNFFLANRQAPWYLVAFGMIGASLSGITFISIPGAVLTTQFTYFQLVLGYLLGYFIIATLLLPLYYRLNLISIYTYLEQRFGTWSYKTGALSFIIARLTNAAFQLFLAINVLQLGLFDHWGIPLWTTTLVSILLIWTYTRKGGTKTLIWSDVLQTTFMLLAAGLTLWIIMQQLHITNLFTTITQSPHSQLFSWDPNHPHYFFKDFLAGAFIAIAMTGLDQNMMQKNLSCRTLPEAQKNILLFCIILVLVNLLFLSLGSLLYLYAEAQQLPLPPKTDQLYPLLAFQHLGPTVALIFIIGLIAATYSSVDSALTALTTSFCVDFLNITQKPELQKQHLIHITHFGIALLLALLILSFSTLEQGNTLNYLLKAVGFTYGPLLGLYTFGLFTARPVQDKLVPFICLLAPTLSFILHENSITWLNGYRFGFEILILNGALTFLGLWLISQRPTPCFSGNQNPLSS